MKKYFFILVALALAVTACKDDKFLEERTYNDDTQSFFKNQKSIEIGLAAAYAEIQYMAHAQLRAGNASQNWMVRGLGLDTISPTSSSSNDQNDGQFADWGNVTSNSGFVRHYGEYMYKLANRANIVVDMIDEHTEIEYTDPNIKETLRAEAVFLRAYAYRVIAGMFGQLVYSEHMTQEARYDYEMLTRQQAWEKIAEDFAYAEQTLPAKPRLMGTVTKAAAAHYLAETYLCLGKFKEAEEAATRVINKTDGDYEIMTKRFGNRKDQQVDRYGNSLAAPQGAYWDLFRTSMKTDGSQADDSNPNAPDNKEAIWVAQLEYTTTADDWPLGGSGDAWARTHFPVLESVLAPWVPMGGKNGTKPGTDGKKYYIFTADAVCFPKGVNPAGAGTPAADIEEAAGRYLANNIRTKIDSIAVAGVANNGGGVTLGLYASEWVVRPAGDILGSYWDDPNDFRGSEIMIQRNYFTPSGRRWYDVKKDVQARVDAGLYTIAASDTVNITPRYWKFSDDKHIVNESNGNCYYDTDWYMIRVAETYLLRAEARLAQNNKSGAADDINVVRRRAGAKDCSASQVNIDYILDERVRELFGEEQRWITLSRLSCNPNATYVTDCYPVQDNTTSNTLYARTRKYGFGYENDATEGRRETYVDARGKTRHIPNIKPYNYVLPIPIAIIQSNKDVKIEQNYGYGE